MRFWTQRKLSSPHRNQASNNEEERPEKTRPRSRSQDSNNDGRVVYIRGLTRDTREKDLENLFSAYGELKEVKVIRDANTQEPRGFGFVTYFNLADANVAIQEMHGKKLGEKTLLVELARRSAPRNKTPGNYLGRRNFPDEFDRPFRGRRRDSMDRNDSKFPPREFDRDVDRDARHRRRPEREHRDRDREGPFPQDFDRGQHRDRGRNNRDRDRERVRDSDRDFDAVHPRDRFRDHDKERDRDYYRDRNREGHRDRDRDRERNRDRERDRDGYRERDRERDGFRERDRDGHRNRERNFDRRPNDGFELEGGDRFDQRKRDRFAESGDRARERSKFKEDPVKSQHSPTYE